MKKRILALALALIMALAVMPPTLAVEAALSDIEFCNEITTSDADVIFSVGSATCRPGDVVTVPITISAPNGYEAHLLNMHVLYNAEYLEVTGISGGEAWSNLPDDASKIRDYTTNLGDVAIGFLCANDAMTATGVFVEISFWVSENCPEDQAISFGNIEMYNYPIGGSLTVIETEGISGYISIQEDAIDYNANDFSKAVAFLELIDENGTKNGDKLSDNYDSSDPSTWGMYVDYVWYYDEESDEWYGEEELIPCFGWVEENDGYRLNYIHLEQEADVVGLLDISNCTDLTSVWCDYNRITGINASGCPNLVSITCDGNNISTIDISQCLSLYSLSCGENRLTSLNVTECPNLGWLFCNSNSLTALDVTQCPNLEDLECYNNCLNALDVTQCSNLIWLGCSDNNLTILDVTQCPCLESLHCDSNSLTMLDVTQCPNLRILWCDNNSLTALDVTQCPNLEALYCSSNSLTALDVTQCPNLERLYCYGNSLTALDVTQCPNLEDFDCSDNNLTALDVTQCPNLKALYCTNNRLTGLDLANNIYIDIDRIVAEGTGYIGLTYYSYYDEPGYCTVYAQGDGFSGWYNEAGTLLSTDSEFDVQDESVLIAKFGEAIPGDIDGNGSVNANDALAVLRAALGIGADVGSAGDVNGDGVVNANDALMILRAALGLISL